jgi:hypothetical protein
VAPHIDRRDIAVVFSSHLYGHAADGTIVVRDQPTDFALGIWFAPAGDREPSLLVEAGRGAAMPIGLSRDGESVAVWYLPDRRDREDPPCSAGIYVLSTLDGSSRLILEGDWAERDDDDGRFSDALGQDVSTRRTNAGSPLVHDLPIASFSANGRSVALRDDDEIALVELRRNLDVHRLPGACTTWAWSPRGGSFVAGCGEMTSAWTFDSIEGFGEDFHAVPRLAVEQDHRNWHAWPAATIGWKPGGDIRVVRFYGIVTGCESPGCSLPPLAWADTTIDPISRRATSRVTEIDFVTYVDQLSRDARLSADASWVYIRSDSGDPRAITIDSGRIVKVRPLGDAVGASADGRLLFGSKTDRDRALVVVYALNRTGTRTEVATISRPVGAEGESRVIQLGGLAVAG